MNQRSIGASALIPILNLPVPPILDEALGYEGEGRCVAFWWEPGGDELCYSDGRRTRCGADRDAWLLYRRHPRVQPYLLPFAFGSSAEATRQALLLDRWERNAYVGTHLAVMDFLDRNLPYNLPDFPGTDAVLSGIRFPASCSPEERQAQRERQYRRWESMVDWLDRTGADSDSYRKNK